MVNDQFIISDDGEVVIFGEWSPPLEEVEARMLSLAQYIENTTVPMIAARQAAIESTERHFETESDPHDRSWTPLSIDYAKSGVKQGSAHPDEILKLTGAGYKAATSEAAWFITEDELWFNPSVLPSYMELHQTGTQSGALTSALSKISTSMTEPQFTAEEASALKEGTGRGQALPQREFIGFNIDDEAEIEAIFTHWIAAGIEEEFPTGITSEGTGFNIVGEFPVIKTTVTGQPILRTSRGPRFGKK